MTKHKIEAAVFDLDGTVIDSMGIWRNTWERTMEEHGPGFNEEYWHSLKGSSTKDMLDEWYRMEAWDGLSKEGMKEKIELEAIGQIKKGVKLMPGVLSTLEFLSKKKISISIASSSGILFILEGIKSVGLEHYFSQLISATEVEKAKPAPDVYKLAARRIGVSTRSMLVFEDSLVGIESAITAGAKCVAIPREEIKNNETVRESDIVLGSLAEFGSNEWLELNK